jgi:hypothetical protein
MSLESSRFEGPSSASFAHAVRGTIEGDQLAQHQLAIAVNRLVDQRMRENAPSYRTLQTENSFFKKAFVITGIVGLVSAVLAYFSGKKEGQYEGATASQSQRDEIKQSYEDEMRRTKELNSSWW